jgi:hypothetical protein
MEFQAVDRITSDRDDGAFNRDQDPMLRAGCVVEVPDLLGLGWTVFRTDPQSDFETSESQGGIRDVNFSCLCHVQVMNADTWRRHCADASGNSD